MNEQDGLAAVKVLGLGSFALKEKSLIDIARVILSGSECPTGSPAYISPEQAVGTEADTLDGRSDLYSLGVLLYHMLAGEPPFGGKNAMQVLLGHVFDDPPPLRNRPGIQVPEVVETLITRSLAKKREQRPSSATAWVDQLRPWEKPALTADSSAEPAQMPAPFTFWQGAFAATSSMAGNGDVEPEGVEKPGFTMDFRPANPTLRPGGPSEIQPPSAPAAPALGGLPPSPSPALSFGANFGPQGPGRPSPPAQTPEAVSAARQADDSETKLVAPMEPESFIIAGLEPEGADSPRSFGRTSGSSIDLDLQERPVLEPVRGPAPLESGARSGSGGSDGQQAEAGLWRSKWLTVVVVVLLGIGLAIGWLYYSGRRYWLRPEYVLGRAESIVAHSSPSAPSSSSSPGSSSATSLPPSVPPPATTGRAASARSSLQPPAQAGPQPQGNHAQKTLNQIATSKPAVSAPPARRGLAASARSSLQPPAQAASQPRGDHAQKALNQIATSKTTVSASSRHKPQSQQAAARNPDAVRDAI
ncbi:MAG: protein kinase domain-containing protein, partial [Terriglobia bacterium]